VPSRRLLPAVVLQILALYLQVNSDCSQNIFSEKISEVGIYQELKIVLSWFRKAVGLNSEVERVMAN